MGNKFKIKMDIFLEHVTDEKKESITSKIKQVFKSINTDKNIELIIDINDTLDKFNAQEFNHITFFEITPQKPFYLFNSGFMCARGATTRLLQEKGIDVEINTNITDKAIVFVSKLEDYISPNSIKRNKKEFKELLINEINNYYSSKNHFSKVWFKKDTSLIYIIGGQDEISTRSGINDDVYNYGDKDTFIDCCIFLSKKMRKKVVLKKNTSDKELKFFNNNLVVIGGPGREHDEGNHYCKKIMDEKSKFSYVFDDEKNDYSLVNKDSGEIYNIYTDEANTKGISSYGYFACFEQAGGKRVILINGIHTKGVLGAFRLFSDEEGTEENYKTILNKALKDNRVNDDKMLEFECFFEVYDKFDATTNQRDIEIPELEENNIFFFNKNGQTKANKKQNSNNNNSKPHPNYNKMKP